MQNGYAKTQMFLSPQRLLTHPPVPTFISFGCVAKITTADWLNPTPIYTRATRAAESERADDHGELAISQSNRPALLAVDL